MAISIKATVLMTDHKPIVSLCGRKYERAGSMLGTLHTKAIKKDPTTSHYHIAYVPGKENIADALISRRLI